MLIETIFHHLFSDDDYYNKVYPHLKDKLFSDLRHTTTFKKVAWFSEKYSKRPEIKDIELVLESDDKLGREETDKCLDFLKKVSELETSKNITLVVDETEKWVKARSMEVAILESVEILEKDRSMGLIEDKVKEALAVSFKNDLGLQYFIDAKKQFEFYTADDENYPTDLSILNEAIGGGFRKESLYMFVGRVGIGKTLWMCHLASCMVKSGLNVIYFTAEMSDTAIAKRIDANILDYEMDELNQDLNKKRYLKKVANIHKKLNPGKFFIKQYPTGYASRTNILSYLQELELKKGVKPDIIIIDYVNIFASARLDSSSAIQSYQYMKAVIEEFRAIAVERECVVISATQFNRSGANSDESNADMTGVSECLDLKSQVLTLAEGYKEIQHIKGDDIILGNDGEEIYYVNVLKVFPIKKKKTFKIKTKSGKGLIISENHKIPTKDGLKTIKTGLKVGDFINTIE